MDHPFLRELSALLQETDKLLACPEPDAEAWEGYGRARDEVFAHLQATGSVAAAGDGERESLRELICAVLERDRLLMLKLEECLACCRKGLATAATAHQALSGYLPPRPPSFVERQV